MQDPPKVIRWFTLIASPIMCMPGFLTISKQVMAIRDPLIATMGDKPLNILRRELADAAVRQGVPYAQAIDSLGQAELQPEVLARQAHQPEFVSTPARYVRMALPDARIESGRTLMRDHHALLTQLDAAFGVPPAILLAIWGLETDFGRVMGDVPVIGSLMTLCHAGIRRSVFTRHLIAAMKIADRRRAPLTGSWAGAMGHTQLMPDTYLRCATDWSASGIADIWSTSPADALASTARCLRQYGWVPHRANCHEVVVPSGFDFAHAGPKRLKDAGAWHALGIKPVRGGSLPIGAAGLILPSGATGPAFLTYRNFEALLHYNRSSSYVLAVSLLASRIRGEEDLVRPWPAHEETLLGTEIKAMQTHLVSLGFDTGGIDGLVGPATIAALRDYQSAHRLTADGYPTRALLRHLVSTLGRG